ncbi:hypothetical protein JW968_05220 [Candidatus Woesearchaeota archaeon]|nr:hypothetical protein [Candidatus Woesearchaeota archaeon]
MSDIITYRPSELENIAKRYNPRTMMGDLAKTAAGLVVPVTALTAVAGAAVALEKAPPTTRRGFLSAAGGIFLIGNAARAEARENINPARYNLGQSEMGCSVDPFLKGTSDSDLVNRIQWKECDPFAENIDLMGYDVFRSVNGEAWEQIASMEKGTTLEDYIGDQYSHDPHSFPGDRTLAEQVRFVQYCVRPVGMTDRGIKEGAWSNTITVIPEPFKPLRAEALEKKANETLEDEEISLLVQPVVLSGVAGNGYCDLTWTADPAAFGYNGEVDENLTGFQWLFGHPADPFPMMATNYRHDGIHATVPAVNGRQYDYRVQSEDMWGIKSPWSNIVSLFPRNQNDGIDLEVYKITGGVELAWNENGSNLYDIYQGTSLPFVPEPIPFGDIVATKQAGQTMMYRPDPSTLNAPLVYFRIEGKN